jgi:iron complex transport system substrate-binding protein
MGKPLNILVAAALAFALAACSDDPAITTGATGGSATASTGAAAFPVTVRGTNGEVTIDARPERIVSLSPTATEDLFAIGAGDQVVAVDDQSNYPADAPTTDLSGFEPNVEAIAGYEPDLVVFATEPGDLASSLEGLGITALQLDAAPNLDVAYDQIEQLGAATGHPDEAAALVEEMRSEVQGIVDAADPANGTSFYYELDDTFYTATSKTFIGQLFRMLGLENIADEVGKGSGGYPQLSAEYIIESDPDLIFLADTKCCGQSSETVAERPGWAELTAVTGDGVVPLDEDVAQRWGPRVVDLLRQISQAASAAEANAA